MTTGSAARRLDRLEERLTGSARSIVIGISESDVHGKLIAVQVEGDRIIRRDGEAHDAFMNRVRAVHPLDMFVSFGKGDAELL